jgi:integrase
MLNRAAKSLMTLPRGGDCMKGNIYPVTVRGKVRYVVRFGRKITKTFQTLKEAERFLTGVRYETDRQTFDERDYTREQPLAFKVLASKWLDLKEQQVRPRSFNNLANYISQAISEWGTANIKTIKYGQIEDFLFSRKVSAKTRANMKSCLHSFFAWACKRESIPMPDFPACTYELNYRKTMDISTQQQVIDTLEKIAPYRIWLACRMLSTYINVRPGELIRIKESDINLELGVIAIPHPKEKKPKFIRLDPDDVELIRAVPRGFPGLYFFRHEGGVQGSHQGQQFGPKLLRMWWNRACKIVGVEGVPLYPGTRHSTVTALGDELTPEQIKAGTGHSTNKAFERYFIAGTREQVQVVSAIKRKQLGNNRKKQHAEAKVLDLNK